MNKKTSIILLIAILIIGIIVGLIIKNLNNNDNKLERFVDEESLRTELTGQILDGVSITDFKVTEKTDNYINFEVKIKNNEKASKNISLLLKFTNSINEDIDTITAFKGTINGDEEAIGKGTLNYKNNVKNVNAQIANL